MRVLIVDDDTEIRSLLRHSVDQALVLEAEDGIQALDLLRSGERVDAVILDVMMPGMSGFDVLAAIRSDRALRDLPVVMLTARAGEPDHLVAYRSGADAYVTKPFELDELNAVLERVIAAPSAERDAVRQQQTAQAELLVRIETSFNR